MKLLILKLIIKLTYILLFMQIILLILTIQTFFSLALSLFQTISFSKELFIPGGYYSLMNFTQNIEPFKNYYDISIDFTLTQAAYGDQANSVYDYFTFGRDDYSTVQPCYQSATDYLNTLYSQY
jgi:hypothetical protein